MLTVIENEISFSIKRVFFIYNVDDSIRGGHRHHKTIQAAICVKGSCLIKCDDGIIKSEFNLDSPSKCLLINPIDWHTMHDFSEDCVLLVLASEYFDINDYIYETY